MTRAFCITARLKSTIQKIQPGTVCWLHQAHDPSSGQVTILIRARKAGSNVIHVANTDLMAIEIKEAANKASARWEGSRNEAVAMALLLAEKDTSVPNGTPQPHARAV